MKITTIETFLVDAGWRHWIFVKVETDDGLVGWGECSDSRVTHGVVGAIEDFRPFIIGKDPRAVEALYWGMFKIARQNLGGIAHKAIAGIEMALWDIKAKALGVPVYELFGGPTRDRIPVYWSHCGNSRMHNAAMLGVEPVRTLSDITRLGKEVVSKGFNALKANVLLLGDPGEVYSPGFSSTGGQIDGVVTPRILRAIEEVIGTFRDAVGPSVGIALDLNFNFRTEGVQRICKLLEPFDMQWVEYDNWDPAALRQIKDSTSTTIASCENLITPRQYRPFFEQHAMDVAIIDVPWNGIATSRRVADMAEAYEIAIAPHNHYSHLATYHAAHLCASVPNVRICEMEIDDVPWKDEMVTVIPEISDGYLTLPKGPGWGTDMREDVLRAHPWPRSR